MQHALLLLPQPPSFLSNLQHQHSIKTTTPPLSVVTYHHPSSISIQTTVNKPKQKLKKGKQERRTDHRTRKSRRNISAAAVSESIIVGIAHRCRRRTPPLPVLL
ncbi:hypothetical protein L195_g037696 [Trifolium pratense]|uniref:Uncharacterized protein n=1 Tax=Trifolium pratense TaxID=57577 RepID=A0A2K3LT12_TRIPR|nr:hypothetical protein L195_g037696 [Trifolium pratense]